MRRICLLVLALGALTLAAGASAKEIMGVKVCGASGCKALTGPDALKPFQMEGNGSIPNETFNVPIGSYYSVETTVGDSGQVAGTQTSYWLSGSGLMRSSDQSSYDPWWQVAEGQNAALQAAAKDIEPFTPDLARVLVSGKPVADPNSYIRLFGYFPPAYRVPPKGSHWVKISVRPSHPNPWLQKAVRIRYQPERRILAKPDGWVVLPKAIGKLLVKRASLAAVKGGSGGGHTALYSGAGVAGAAAIALLAAARRKRIVDSRRKR